MEVSLDFSPIDIALERVKSSATSSLVAYITNRAIEEDLDPSVVLAIIKCESNLNPEAINHNRNGTSDYGLWQINDIHRKTTQRLGYDIKTLEGNLDFGLYLMKKSGNSPWGASKKCWDH